MGVSPSHGTCRGRGGGYLRKSTTKSIFIYKYLLNTHTQQSNAYSTSTSTLHRLPVPTFCFTILPKTHRTGVETVPGRVRQEVLRTGPEGSVLLNEEGTREESEAESVRSCKRWSRIKVNGLRQNGLSLSVGQRPRR